MRLFQHNNGIWYVEIGRNNRKSCRTRDKSVAEKMFEKAKEEYWDEKIPQIINDIVSGYTRRDAYGDIYFIQASPDGLIKIGFSTNFPTRFGQLQNMIPFKVKLLVKIRGNMKREEEIQEMFSKYRHHGEWFSPAPEILEYISNLKSKKK